jgi:hypothetical protein
MSKLIANEDLLVEFSNTTGQTYSGDQGIDAVKIVPTKSTHCKILNKAMCTTGITLTFIIATPCPHSFAGHTFVSGAGSISTTATKVKADGQVVLRADDSGTCAGSWTNTSTGATVACSCNCKIANAGQNKVKGN